MTDPQKDLTHGVPIRAMTKEEVGYFISLLGEKEQEWWNLWRAEKNEDREFYRRSAKTYAEVRRELLWLLDGPSPEKRAGEE